MKSHQMQPTKMLPDIPIAAFREIPNVLQADERKLIIRQVYIALRDYYVHLPLKVSSLAINPLQECLLLEDDLPFIAEDREFFRRMMLIVEKLRDRHTNFVLPAPWSLLTAYLPFAVESCWVGDRRVLLVSKTTGTLPNERFVSGVEITHWNGVPIRRHIENFSWQTLGSNPASRIAMALRSLTARSLAYYLPPDEDWVSLTFVGSKGIETVVVPWMIYTPDLSGAPGGPGAFRGGDVSVARVNDGLDRNLSAVNQAWETLYSGHVSTAGYVAPITGIERYIKWSTYKFDNGEIGYLRIFSFECDDTAWFLRELAALLAKMPSDGLIVDVRANPGGNIPCGEGLLQLISNQRISPQPVSFRSTPATRGIANGIEYFREWRPSLNMIYDTGEVFSQGYPLTDSVMLASLRPINFGKIVIICDGLSYSTTDFFVAGARDNNVGTIIGVDPMTGAGGANVWQHNLIVEFAKHSNVSGIEPIPSGASFNVAVRRSIRVGENAGIPVEGLGAKPDVWYRLTPRDVLSNNEDLISFAAAILLSR